MEAGQNSVNVGADSNTPPESETSSSHQPTKSDHKKLNVKIYVAIVAVILAALISSAVYLALQQKKNAPTNKSPGLGIGSITTNSDASNRNAQRKADVNTILSAVYQYSIDNQGNIPSQITTTPTDICATSNTGTTNCAGLVDLSVLTTNGKYLVAVPSDPSTGTATDTHYQISQDSSGRIIVAAPDAENGESISATR